ncbi:MAG: hypothetical protein F7C07_05280 [Desulfurococcales archaeon]|nr:hypothetical protein [Desulfurococcales archaeon]
MKRQLSSVTKASYILGVYYAVIDYIEVEAPDRYEAYPDECLVDEDLVTGLDPWNPPVLAKDRFYLVVPGSSEEVFEKQVGDRLVEFVVSSEGSGASYEELLAKAPRIPFTFDGSLIKELAAETSRTGIEYIFLYSSDGYLFVLEGGYLRVNIPFVRVVGSVHTHPEGSCGLSSKDVESGLDLLSEGGLFEAAATPACYFYMARTRSVSEEDYVKARMIRGDILEPLRLETIVFDKGYY